MLSKVILTEIIYINISKNFNNLLKDILKKIRYLL